MVILPYDAAEIDNAVLPFEHFGVGAIVLSPSCPLVLQRRGTTDERDGSSAHFPHHPVAPCGREVGYTAHSRQEIDTIRRQAKLDHHPRSREILNSQCVDGRTELP